MINVQCSQSTHCTHGTHSINISGVLSAIRNLKHDNNKIKNGDSEIVSDHIIYSGESLSVHIAILFTTVLRHGLTPDGMFTDTMILIPKGTCANLSTSDNFRTITQSSILCKLLDVILTKVYTPVTYSMVSGRFPLLVYAILQETILYYVHNGSNVYGLMLDASKAFDHVNYCKLFCILLDKNVCPLNCRLLLNMYLNQKLRVRWNSTHS